jgi:hypothetical protein
MSFDDPMYFLALTGAVAAVGVVVSSLEMLAVRAHYRSGGLFSWEVNRSRLSAPGRARLSGVRDPLFAYPSVLLPPEYAWPILVAGALFHVGNAVISGLNTFVWSYLALYPSVIFCNHVVQQALWGK